MKQGFITTSWDDGHPLDLRLAELLAKYDLHATFYIPRTSDRPTMGPTEIRDLSSRFEIGAHTLRHIDLSSVDDQTARQEIAGSKNWIEEVTGMPCEMFCPPKGKFRREHLSMIRDAGYTGARTVELLSISPPRRKENLMLMPTTLQAHPHSRAAYARNISKRFAIRNLWLYITHGGRVDWLHLTDSLAHCVVHRGGVFHLWGHSWELEEAGQWRRLEEALRMLRDVSQSIPSRTNGQLCREFLNCSDPRSRPYRAISPASSGTAAPPNHSSPPREPTHY